MTFDKLYDLRVIDTVKYNMHRFDKYFEEN